MACSMWVKFFGNFCMACLEFKNLVGLFVPLRRPRRILLIRIGKLFPQIALKGKELPFYIIGDNRDISAGLVYRSLYINRHDELKR